MESERLGGSGLDHLPNIKPHAQREQLEFIHQSYIYAAVNIFEQLRHFRRSGRRNWHGAIEDCSVECAREFGCWLIKTANYFRNIPASYGLVPRIFTLRRECPEK